MNRIRVPRTEWGVYGYEDQAADVRLISRHRFKFMARLKAWLWETSLENAHCHGTGHAYLVPPMASAAIAAGADGLIVEVHPSPEDAMSDGYQSLTPEQFSDMMVQCRRIAEAMGKSI